MSLAERISRANEVASQVWLSELKMKSPISSNVGSAELPFQRWFHFKEAYSPEFVMDSVRKCDYDVKTILDPFGGSGTTSLTARMHGIDSVSIEVNPFLADLARAKTTYVSPSSFANLCRKIIDELQIIEADYLPIEGGPKTLLEPGVKGKFVFHREIYGTLRAINRKLRDLPEVEGRLGRILLGSILVECSNVRVNGKGRRYRRNWQSRVVSQGQVLAAFEAAVTRAVEDLLQYKEYSLTSHEIINGDSRVCIDRAGPADLAVFSPPYPNSFDYTDVYNLELWMLGYLDTSTANRILREKTLRSHVQVKWGEVESSLMSGTLVDTYSSLRERRSDLWDRSIPEMVLGYFDDLGKVLGGLSRALQPGHYAVAAVGDSQYAGVKIDVPRILSEMCIAFGFEVDDSTAIRSMRSSAQHGGKLELSETAIRFRRLNDMVQR